MEENSEYDFIVDSIKYSYSSTSTFDNCPYSFKLTYIDALPRKNNFFAEYGLLVHSALEQYFSGNLESFELSQYYLDNYNKFIKSPCPFNGEINYRNQGLEFFDNFSMDRENFEILATETKIDFKLGDFILTARPDLVVIDKNTGKTVLYDFKTSNPYRLDKRTGKVTTDIKKIEDYLTQMYIYTYAFHKEKGLLFDEISLLFPRANRTHTVQWLKEKEDEAVNWLIDKMTQIKSASHFPYNNTNPFFCNSLCSVREYCEYRPK